MRPVLSILAFLSILGLSARAAEPPAAQPKAAPGEVIDTPESNASDPAKAGQPGPSAAPAPAQPASAPSASEPAPAAPAAVKTPGNAGDTAAVMLLAAPGDTQATPLLAIHGPGLARLDLGGTVQVKGFYHDMTSDRDADKSLSLTLRRFNLDLDGSVDAHFGFRGDLLLDGNGRNFGVDDAYLYYTLNDLVGFKGGKLKRPFSQEALQSSNSLYTIERGELYQNFLISVTGYSYYDVGLVAYGGFEDDGRSVGYELGVFNGKQNDDPSKNYSGQQDVAVDKGFKAKDVVMRITATPFRELKVEAAVSTKAAEDTTNADDFIYNVNTAYELGFTYVCHHLRLLGEASLGDNQNRIDARIISGSSEFFAFYGMGVWREDYARGRASELVLKLEGLDPDFGWRKGEGKPNDGKLRYTLGVNYFFNPRVSLMGDYGVLQPITEVTGQKDLIHDLDVMWRLSF